VKTRSELRVTACVECLDLLPCSQQREAWGRPWPQHGWTGIRDCLKNLEATEIVARITSPCVPLPEGEGIVKPRQLYSLSLRERVGVRVRKRITASIGARLGPHPKIWDSFILPVIQRKARCLSHQFSTSPPSQFQFRILLSALAICGSLLPTPSVTS
jgi:hypothetical protein